MSEKNCEKCIFNEILKGSIFCQLCKKLEWKAFREINKKNLKKRGKLFLKLGQQLWEEYG